MKRDLSKEQFEYRATKLGFKKGGFMGYWQLASNPSMNVSVWNAGKRNRDRLRYLTACDRAEQARLLAAGSLAAPSDPSGNENQPAAQGSPKSASGLISYNKGERSVRN